MEGIPINTIIKPELIRFEMPYSDIRVIEIDGIEGILQVFGSDLNKPVCTINFLMRASTAGKIRPKTIIYVEALRDLIRKILPEKTD